MSDTPAFESPAFADEEDLEDEVGPEEANRSALEVDDAGVNRQEGGAATALLDHLARSIVDEPDAVAIDVGRDRAGLRLSLHVAPGDMGRVIGKRGRVAQAIRSLVRAAAARDGTDATVDIVD